MIKKLILFLSVFSALFAEVILYKPKDFSAKSINNIRIKTYKNINEIDFNNSLAILDYNQIPFILKNNLSVITPLGEAHEYILTNQKPLSKIKTIANLDFGSKILLDRLDGNYKEVNATFKDFLQKKVDAIVWQKDIDNNKIYDFKLKNYGIYFNRYFLVASKNFIKTHKKFITDINFYFEKNFDFKKDLVYKTFLISAFYLHKKIDFNNILFENYNLIKEINEKPLIVEITPNWPPLDMYQNGRLYGIGVDFWKLIAKKAQLQYTFKKVYQWNKILKDIKNKKADLSITSSKTKDREKYALFSKAYISFPFGIICRNNENFNFVNEIKSIAVGKNFTAEKLMKKYYPKLNYVEVKNTLEALRLVEQKKVQCAVDVMPVILWIINQNNLMNLQIAFKTPFKFHVQIMVRHDRPDLIERINDAIDKISENEKENIINKYTSAVVVEKNAYWNFVFLAAALFLIIIFVIFYIKYHKVKKESEFDELTKILNRRGLEKKLKDIEKGVILFFDIDHFKNVNDTYGHEFGDFVLSEIGTILKKTFRKSDCLGRWGGEEFIVVLPHTNYEDGLKLAEKVRKTIENYSFKNVKITISIGIGEFKNKKEFEQALNLADEALYKAKNNGRNQIKGYK